MKELLGQAALFALGRLFDLLEKAVGPKPTTSTPTDKEIDDLLEKAKDLKPQ